MANKAIIFDIDGTAINSPKQKVATPRLVKATQDLEKIYFVCAATGRCWTFAKKVIKSLKLKSYCVISGGSQICEAKTGKIIWQENITSGSLKKIINIFMEENPNHKLLFNEYSEKDYLKKGGIFLKNFDITTETYWIGQSFVPDKIADKLEKKFKTIKNIQCVTMATAKAKYKDVYLVNKTATKDHAIKQMLKKLKVKKLNTIGIGDGGNDIDLFKAVETKVAMKNADDKLKRKADVIIGDVEDEGLAEYFEILIA